MTTFDDQTILVFGATGRQCGASTRRLLAKGFRVRALVRDPSRAAAHALVQVGAQLAVGDLDDRASVERALDGIYGVHLVQAYMPKEPEREVRQGAMVVDAARVAGVQHFAYQLPERTATSASKRRKANGRSSSTCNPPACLPRSYVRRTSWTTSSFIK